MHPRTAVRLNPRCRGDNRRIARVGLCVRTGPHQGAAGGDERRKRQPFAGTAGWRDDERGLPDTLTSMTPAARVTGHWFCPQDIIVGTARASLSALPRHDPVADPPLAQCACIRRQALVRPVTHSDQGRQPGRLPPRPEAFRPRFATGLAWIRPPGRRHNSACAVISGALSFTDARIVKLSPTGSTRSAHDTAPARQAGSNHFATVKNFASFPCRDTWNRYPGFRSLEPAS